jgi:Fe-S-cluster containining protein
MAGLKRKKVTNMSKKMILTDLPAIYSRFLPAFFKNEIPVESLATCHDCAMVCKTPHKQLKLKPYLPDVMCCSYFPGLPNYLVGGLLLDTDPALDEGRKRIRKIIRDRTGVSPVGIQPSAKYSLFYTRTDDTFGQSKLLLCPYFDRDKKNCTIWKYRDATCSTYFCKIAAGDAGKTFWKALRRYLFHIQKQLCHYVIIEMKFHDLDKIVTDFNFGPKMVESISLRDIEELGPSEESYKKIWQDWAGREEELYKNAYNLINGLSTEEFDKINGITAQMVLKKLENDWRKMMGIPATLIKNPAVDFREVGEDNYILFLESIDASLQVPKVLLDSFDGIHTCAEIRELLEQTHNIEIDDEFMLTLYHYEILVKNPS